MGRTIDPKIEAPTREMLEYAIRGDLEELTKKIDAVGAETYQQIIGLCMVAAGYIAVHASDRWPTDADLRQIASGMVRVETRLTLDEEMIYGYLSGGVLGFKDLAEAMGSTEAALYMPVLITGSMLFNLCPHEMHHWEYLDQIWNSTLAAENLDESVLPAVQVRIHRTALLKAREKAAPGSGGKG